MTPELSLLWVQTEQIGYGRLGEQIARGLRGRGVTVYDNPDAKTNLICTVSFPTHTMGAWDGQHQAVFTMWETNRLPENFRETFHEFQTIVVPSTQNVEMFSEFHPNVQLCLLGVDPELWHYEPVPEVGAFFDFLFSGRGERKGIDVAYKAFRTVFSHDPAPGKPVPRLILKSRLGIGEYFGGNVIPMVGVMDALDEVNLYRQAHCYLQPAKGEGFGLQPLQAIAMGRPTILTNAHGHASFADLGIPIGYTMTNSGEFMFAGKNDEGNQAGEWWEPDLEELCEAMWDVYSNYDAHAERAKKSAAVVAERFTWSNTVDRFTEIFAAEMDKPYTGTGTWIPHERELFVVITNKDHTIQSAGITKRYLPGEEYWESADIKRSLFDAGVLSPLCLLGEKNSLGLHPRQIAYVDKYNAAKSSCASCGQVLNSVPMAADLIEKAWAT